MVEGHLAALDLGDQLPTELLERLGGDHVDALVGAFDQVAVFAEVGSIGAGSATRPLSSSWRSCAPTNITRASPPSSWSTCLDAEDGNSRPSSPRVPIMVAKCPNVNHSSPPEPTTRHLLARPGTQRLTTCAPTRGPRLHKRGRRQPGRAGSPKISRRQRSLDGKVEVKVVSVWSTQCIGVFGTLGDRR